MWIEGGLIKHDHYSKPMASKEVILARSLMSNSMKRDILVQEGGRRLRNCSPSLPWDQKARHVTDLMVSMMKAGHRETFRETVVMRILARYDNNVKLDDEGTKHMYR